ncbi:peptidoglycan-binding protein [Streptomyces sp. 71268]|uniref:peptidoglycan-binding domain-containing protein n=1 Tax=Streptomyces sp. 71268 TaxID=3002640 RepID=UPI0023FA0C01|nr:peptidoglycan-binding protein [Streptomyces sp. 71268]WEV26719.1 peptidoglycan-binding protein [Streptomyces sp. 71268]
MRPHPTRPTATTAATAVLLAAGALLSAPGAAQAATPRTTSPHASTSAGDAAPGQGVEWFQARHGLPRTGTIDRATARALERASGAELRRTFRTAADLGPEELANARTVVGVGKGAGIPEQGQVIALMTAMQESKFVNYLVPVDHDSLGIFQQRPSTGWGTPEQITDVPTSSRSFYGVAPFGSNPGLIQIDGWQTMPPGDVCQAVQVSAFPDRYAQWEQFARDLLARESPTVPPIY